MPRPKRKQVHLDKQSIEQILQESYNETCENRSSNRLVRLTASC